MPCYLLHMVEQPDTSAYEDADLKDLVGDLPRLFCALETPPRALRAGESVRCFECSQPCWEVSVAARARMPGSP